MAQPLTAFVFVSLDGRYAGPRGDLSWHLHGPEDAAYAEDNLRRGSALLFGRKTWQMMAGWWPSPMAAERDPGVAKGMNAAVKYVVSRQPLQVSGWQGSTLLRGEAVKTVAKLKAARGRGLTVLGSGTLVRALLEAGLLDRLDLLVCPVVLERGPRLFQGALELERLDVRPFQNGSTLLRFAPR